jgi:hypothetical protein
MFISSSYTTCFGFMQPSSGGFPPPSSIQSSPRKLPATLPRGPLKQPTKTEIMLRLKPKTPWPKSASELYRLSDRHLLAKLVPTLSDRGCRVVSATDRYGGILGFLDRSRYFFLQVAPEMYSRRWVDPVPDPLLLRKSGNAGNRARTSGSVARNSDR